MQVFCLVLVHKQQLYKHCQHKHHSCERLPEQLKEGHFPYSASQTPANGPWPVDSVDGVSSIMHGTTEHHAFSDSLNIRFSIRCSRFLENSYPGLRESRRCKRKDSSEPSADNEACVPSALRL